MATWYLCDCDVWVEAQKCPNNDADARVFVHQDHFPASKSWFNFLSDDPTTVSGRNCWSIDPTDPKVCLPKSDNPEPIFTYNGSFDYTSCTACENDTPTPDDPPGGGGGGGGGGGSGGGGVGGIGPGNPPPDQDPDAPEGKSATVCAGHEQRAADRGWDVDNLYVSANQDDGIYDIGGICVSVSGSAVTNPASAYWLHGGVEYATCSDCTDGGEATLCPGDQDLPGAGDAPSIWIRKPDLGSVANGFEYGPWCYEAPSSTDGVVPEDAIVLNPTTDLECSSCNRGVQYQLCADEPNAPSTEYWADGRDIDRLLDDHPDLTSVYMRIDGYCHSLDLTATRSRIPLDAEVVAPRCAFADCAACFCTGEMDTACGPEQGIPVHLCADQLVAPGYRLPWLHEDQIPLALTYFSHDRHCVFVDPNDAVREVPADAELLREINNAYESCEDCLSSRGGGGSGGGGGEFDPLPPWLPPIPDARVFKLRECESGQLTNYWINENHVCAILGVVPCDLRGSVIKASPTGIADKCYELVGPFNESEVSGSETTRVTGGTYTDCADCGETNDCWHYWSIEWNCDTGRWENLLYGFSECRTPADGDPSPTQWTATAADACIFEKYTKDPRECAADGDCPEPNELQEPDPPDQGAPDRCCQYRLWTVVDGCDGDGWGEPTSEDKNLPLPDGVTENQWDVACNSTGGPIASCSAQYYQVPPGSYPGDPSDDCPCGGALENCP